MRFHFDLTDGRTTMSDVKGAEAADLGQAIDQAELVIEELRGAGELLDVDGPWDLLIRDAEGRVLHRMPVVRTD
ncbi:hypothetical protein ASF49_22060 [Methylobacterium sp. Leaf104]|uniref:DUF6894 family protein n=1 Tax=Methylobacterium TaxID=407 RepID=UPI0006F419C8|nr:MULTISPECIES: hypothetical protein [Methylobacterium]KQP37632.1 hypothetical protein ASF49_22060 [Methylobacterium sp. Leaf104]MCI9881400.1 hypothetical protein [Methylobacterium goesingense]